MNSSIKYFSLVLFFALLNFNCHNNSSNSPSSTTQLSVADFEQKLNNSKDAQLIDVRTPEEFNTGHLLTAVNIDWKGTDFDRKIETLDKSKPVFVYCHSGNRSHEAAKKMESLGFKEIYELKGGIKAWSETGKALAVPDIHGEQKNLSLKSYQNLVNNEKLVMVDFAAPWCAPCNMMAPVLDEIAKEQEASLQLIKINVDENTELRDALMVESIPTLILYKNGKEVWKKVGLTDKIALMVAIESAKN